MIVNLLRRYRGKFVVLKLTSAEEVGGRILSVRNGIVVLKTLLGTKIHVPLHKIVAVITR